ncbi:MAG: hypothetical protein JWN04_5879 [Myxococcaceae bacterium]|nr:hypothetical protein [Myxococcaceae bacterium]
MSPPVARAVSPALFDAGALSTTDGRDAGARLAADASTVRACGREELSQLATLTCEFVVRCNRVGGRCWFSTFDSCAIVTSIVGKAGIRSSTRLWLSATSPTASASSRRRRATPRQALRTCRRAAVLAVCAASLKTGSARVRTPARPDALASRSGGAQEAHPLGTHRESC